MAKGASVFRICLHSGARSPRFVLSRLLPFFTKNFHVSVRLLAARRNRAEKQRSGVRQIFSRENLSHRKQPSSPQRKNGTLLSQKFSEYNVDFEELKMRDMTIKDLYCLRTYKDKYCVKMLGGNMKTYRPICVPIYIHT